MQKLEVHSVERSYLRQRCFDASKPRVAASTVAQYQYVRFSRRNKIPRCSGYDLKPRIAVATRSQYGFSRRNKIPRCSAYVMGESNPVPHWAQKLISSSMSQHLWTRNISSKSMHAFLSNLAHRQTDRQTDKRTNAGARAKTYSSSVVGRK